MSSKVLWLLGFVCALGGPRSGQGASAARSLTQNPAGAVEHGRNVETFVGELKGVLAGQEHMGLRYKGRVIAPVMGHEGAAWLERGDREITEQPEKVLDALKLAKGSAVADVGAGTGYFSLRMARRVGPQGRVYAIDVQPEMLVLLREAAAKAGMNHITPILGDVDDTKLPADSVDLALFVDVYHELSYPEEVIESVHRSLRKAGRLVLVEYRGEDPRVPIKPLHKMTKAQVRKEIEPMGFRLAQTLDFLPHQHIFVFEKAALLPVQPFPQPKP